MNTILRKKINPNLICKSYTKINFLSVYFLNKMYNIYDIFNFGQVILKNKEFGDKKGIFDPGIRTDPVLTKISGFTTLLGKYIIIHNDPTFYRPYVLSLIKQVVRKFCDLR